MARATNALPYSVKGSRCHRHSGRTELAPALIVNHRQSNSGIEVSTQSCVTTKGMLVVCDRSGAAKQHQLTPSVTKFDSVILLCAPFLNLNISEPLSAVVWSVVLSCRQVHLRGSSQSVRVNVQPTPSKTETVLRLSSLTLPSLPSAETSLTK